MLCAKICLSLSFHAFYMSQPFDHPNNICQECHFGGCSQWTSVHPSATFPSDVWILSWALCCIYIHDLCVTSGSILVSTSINNVLYILFFTFSYRKLLKWILALIFHIHSPLNLTHVSCLCTLITAVCGWNFVLLNGSFIWKLLIRSPAVLLSYLMFEY